jgi:diguanylate cyclase (GGDEF)-like protein
VAGSSGGRSHSGEGGDGDVGRDPDERRLPPRPDVPTILVVDDSTAIRRIIGRALTTSGHRVVEAADGRAALEACRAQRPDLVLLDIDMPIMDGPATLREMRADAELGSVPVIFLTARTGGSDVAAGLQLGAQDYLRKPCEPVELVARVRMVLRASAQEEALARQARDLDELSTTDALTGLGNRRRLQASIGDLAAAHGHDAEVALVLFDVDHFKAVNDTFGHAVGDVVLQIAAARLREAVGTEVVVVRWGGEEFVAVCEGSGAAAAHAIAEKARRAVEASPFATGIDQTIPVTISAGCAVGPLVAFETTLEAADRALYAAKQAGRNQVALAGRDS